MYQSNLLSEKEKSEEERRSLLSLGNIRRGNYPSHFPSPSHIGSRSTSHSSSNIFSSPSSSVSSSFFNELSYDQADAENFEPVPESSPTIGSLSSHTASLIFYRPVLVLSLVFLLFCILSFLFLGRYNIQSGFPISSQSITLVQLDPNSNNEIENESMASKSSSFSSPLTNVEYYKPSHSHGKKSKSYSLSNSKSDSSKQSHPNSHSSHTKHTPDDSEEEGRDRSSKKSSAHHTPSHSHGRTHSESSKKNEIADNDDGDDDNDDELANVESNPRGKPSHYTGKDSSRHRKMEKQQRKEIKQRDDAKSTEEKEVESKNKKEVASTTSPLTTVKPIDKKKENEAQNQPLDEVLRDREKQSQKILEHQNKDSKGQVTEVKGLTPKEIERENKKAAMEQLTPTEEPPQQQQQKENKPEEEGDQPIQQQKDQSVLTSQLCEPPYPGYPFCISKVNELQSTWRKDPDTEASYREGGIDGSKCSFLNYLNLHGFFCPEAKDWNRMKIRGVNLGGWLVLEPWIKPSLFTQFAVEQNVVDQWSFCETLGPEECKKQLEVHWDTFLTLADLTELAAAGINHVRIPIGHWILGDIKDGEPWVTGELKYLERAIVWASQVGLHVILDLHCAPGSQNGFDNSGRRGEIHFADSKTESNGRVIYPNIERALDFIDALTQHFAATEYKGTVVGIELVNEAFITIPIEIVKDYYLQGYERVKKYGDLAVIIGDSFRFGAWDDFMFPPHYRHVWIDTHIYQVFDLYRLTFNWQQHLDQTCKINKPEVAVAPLSTMVGEWSLATVDCARWLNGYNAGARFDGTFHQPWEDPAPLGSCIGQDDIHNTTIWTPEYRRFLREFSEKQMDAYESGSSAGWFFWNFKTEEAPQWNYLLGLREGWIPKDHNNRKYSCSD